MAAELDKVGIHGAYEGALKYAGNPAMISRAHFARYLVEIGVCKDVRSVFESYLVPGRPGYVDHRWATLPESVRWIETITAPVKVLILFALLGWAWWKADGFGPLLGAPSQFVEGGKKEGQFWALFWPTFTAMSGYWSGLAMNIPDFTRFARSQRDQVIAAAALEDGTAAQQGQGVVVDRLVHVGAQVNAVQGPRCGQALCSAP